MSLNASKEKEHKDQLFGSGDRPVGWGSGEGQKGTPGRGRDRKCHDRASLSRPLVLSLEPLTSLASFPFFCTSEDIHVSGGRGL